MIQIRLRRHYVPEEGEDYFVSMTDMMVGVVFIFIILLVAFALNYKKVSSTQRQSLEGVREAIEKVDQEIDRIREIEKQRAQLLKDLKRRLIEEGVAVSINEQSDVLRFQDEILFKLNKAELSDAGKRAIHTLGSALLEVLPCYANLPDLPRPSDCPTSEDFTIESVFVEGHTDQTGEEDYNWKLSAARAISSYNALKEDFPKLANLRNSRGEYLFSVSGYAWHRPVVLAEPEEIEPRNRRIDLRFAMAVSYEKALQRIKGELEEILSTGQ